MFCKNMLKLTFYMSKICTCLNSCANINMKVQWLKFVPTTRLTVTIATHFGPVIVTHF